MDGDKGIPTGIPVGKVGGFAPGNPVGIAGMPPVTGEV